VRWLLRACNVLHVALTALTAVLVVVVVAENKF
jgi:hypothetical protein